MSVLIVRHGYSEGNHDLDAYLEKGDCGVGLMDEGWKQAIQAGHFIEKYYQERGITEWPYVFLSAYQRTQETLSGIVHGMRGEGLEGQPIIHLDPLLIERFSGATLSMRKGDGPVDWRVAANFSKLAQQTYDKDWFTTRNLLGDSNKDIYMAVKSFVNTSLRQAMAKGHDDILIVCHGVVYREFIRVFGDLPFTADLKLPNNCDILEATQNEDYSWNARHIYDGEAMSPIPKDKQIILDGKHHYGFDDLPPVPDHLR